MNALPAGVWEFCEPEGTPLQPLARDQWGPVNDRQRKRDSALTAHFEDESDGELIAVRESTPNLMSTLKRAQEAAMSDVTMNEHAPYGYKADGTPKKSNGGRKPKNATVAPAPAPVLTDEQFDSTLHEDAPPLSIALLTDEQKLAMSDEQKREYLGLTGLEPVDPIVGAVRAIESKIDRTDEELDTLDAEMLKLDEALLALQAKRDALANAGEKLNQAKRTLMDLAA